MSEMIDIMQRKIFMNICMRIEELCAELYHYYSKIYADIPEAASLWRKTALEEENHRRQFELAVCLLRENEFDVPDDSLRRAYIIQHKLMKLVEQVRDCRPELITAVARAVEMEEKLADLHVHTALNFKEESLRKLFQSMSEADHDHIADIQRYQTILYLPQCEMGG